MRCCNPRSRQGVTLLELMIALGVIAIALFAMVTMIMYTVTTKEAQRELSLAKEAAQKRLDEIKGQPWTALSAVTPPGPAYAGFSVEGLVNPASPDGLGLGTVTFASPPRADPITPGAVSLVDVVVRVDWKGVHGNASYSLRSLLTQ